MQWGPAITQTLGSIRADRVMSESRNSGSRQIAMKNGEIAKKIKNYVLSWELAYCITRDLAM